MAAWHPLYRRCHRDILRRGERLAGARPYRVLDTMSRVLTESMTQLHIGSARHAGSPCAAHGAKLGRYPTSTQSKTAQGAALRSCLWLAGCPLADSFCSSGLSKLVPVVDLINTQTCCPVDKIGALSKGGGGTLNLDFEPIYNFTSAQCFCPSSQV